LLYATINDSLEINRSDTNWLKKDVCIQLKIDTIYFPSIKEFKKDNRFYYNGHIFNKSQLFDIKSFQYLTDFYIKKFGIACTGAAFEPPCVYNEFKCTSQEQIYYLKEYWKVSRRYPNKQFKVYFSEITAVNIDNKSIILNDVICYLK
jgi:hypothetical protein